MGKSVLECQNVMGKSVPDVTMSWVSWYQNVKLFWTLLQQEMMEMAAVSDNWNMQSTKSNLHHYLFSSFNNMSQSNNQLSQLRTAWE